MARLVTAVLFVLLASPHFAVGQSFEDAVVDIGNIGLTVTNAGFFGRANVRNAPTGSPSMEYPLDSGVEHLFESGLWIGAIRSDGTMSVRTGAVTVSNGYRPGATGYEFAQSTPIFRRSTLPESDAFTSAAVSHLDYLATFVDTAAVLPGTSIQMPDVEGRLGASVDMESYAWNFPFTEYFVIVNFDIVNISDASWDSVYVGMYHDIVTRNINTTTETGGAFFNKGGYGFLDSLTTTYGFNAGGTEETINTYGAISFLGAEWKDPRTGQRRFFHPGVADEYLRDGYPAPTVEPRWWAFSGGANQFTTPTSDQDKYERMSTPYPNPASFGSTDEFLTAKTAWRDRLRTDGQSAAGNWIGLTPSGPYSSVLPGDTLRVTFAFVGALKPEEYQGAGGKIIDTEDSRRILVGNIEWARRTFAGEDSNYNGRLDAGEDVNNNGGLDRYLIPEPPSSPKLRVEFENDTDPITGQQDGRVVLYWDRSSEEFIDPVTGIQDFEGYRVYRTNPGDDRSGNILDRASLVAQFDTPGNTSGFNNGFNEVALQDPVSFPDDPIDYWYRLEVENLLNGWQYLFTLTAFDSGDPEVGLPSFESSRVANATRVFPGTPANDDGSLKVGVYPNPYRANAAWDGGTNRTRRLNFYNLPPRAEIRVYTLAGEIVKEMVHEADTYIGDIRWYDTFSAENRQLPGGEHSWDILSENSLNIAGGLYLYTVKNLDSGDLQRGKFVIIK
ncbi:MAG: hypothetical protein ACI80V_002666 [Rhodothermales bacterium]|jgi:hypothetical protein